MSPEIISVIVAEYVAAGVFLGSWVYDDDVITHPENRVPMPMYLLFILWPGIMIIVLCITLIDKITGHERS